ncbi:MarR family transcriptional regulator [Nocardioides sp. zg-579]|uniref:MarR family transcriptional regulator n=1 Tax=Nocardioides marmotae TaxID=2663857 RepID=A0A6I3J0T9_9ACTN|nr:MarR family transcriptional regulator [Nocardioides marmotae]MCR6030214.1 MarR family transcriptional regulator [Gordonia jinghuaiqii]MTB93846.1 MarR family transcriptional regulator [Nocardioides marmotae]QKE00174.1 MarR family transcriptional regulator [Nocardioides marmotae]
MTATTVTPVTADPHATGATGRDDSLRRLEQEVGVLMRRVRRVIGERARTVHPDLQPASYFMLDYLIGHGPVRASEIAEVFGIDKGAISRQVQHLLELGLVDRSPDPNDGRATLLAVSADAARRIEEVATARRRYLDQRLDDWTDDDLADLAASLGRYNATLGPE